MTQGSGGEGRITELMIQHLSRTKVWVILISVLLFIGSGFLLLASLGMIIMGAAGSASGGIENALGGIPAVGAGVLYILFSLLYIYPAVKLWKYGSSIKQLTMSRSVSALEIALDQQRAFWKFTGIIAIIMIVFYIVLIVGLIVAGVAGLTN